MKKQNKSSFPEQVLNAHNIRRPVENGDAVVSAFSGRTNCTVKVGELIETAKIVIALRKQLSLQKTHLNPSG